MKHRQSTENIFDFTLTPYNAKNKGYMYIDDVIYNPRKPSEAMKDVLQFCKYFHCKLGKASFGNGIEEFFGLYLQERNS